MVLVVTVLVLSILMVLGYAFSFSAGVSRRAARNVRDALARQHAAESALTYGLAVLRADGVESEFDALTEQWAAPEVEVEVGAEEWSISIVDADGRLNVNRAVWEPPDPEEDVDLRPALRRVVECAGGAERDFEAICAWLDPAEPIMLISSLKDAPDLDPDLFSPEPGEPALDALLTTHSRHVNANTASEEVLGALLGDEETTGALLQRRDRQPFGTRAELEAFLDTLGAPESVLDAARFLDVTSEFFIISISNVGPRRADDLTAFVRRSGNAVQVLHLRRGPEEENQ